MTTATYRDYNDDLPEAGQFSIDTSGHRAVIIEIWDDGEGELGQRAEFTRNQARDFGKCLIAWTGSDWAFALSAQHTFQGEPGPGVTLDVTDGGPTLRVGNGPDFEATSDITHDMGIRLLAFAGPELPKAL